MNILIPMAGAGSRFKDLGYLTHKPAIPTTFWKSGQKLPMVVCAALDLPGIGSASRLVLIDRDFHRSGGVQDSIRRHLPMAEFITIDHLTEGQASTCLLAREIIDTSEELLIAGCDNGMVIDQQLFDKEKTGADVLVFTYKGHSAVKENPAAYGWCIVDKENNIRGMSVKKPISQTPENDHAVVATFYFKKGSDFVRATDKMIQENDRINGEFYVDQVIQHCLDLGMKTKVFQIDRYLGWGTPRDYEAYESTLDYWNSFQTNDQLFKAVNKS